MLPRPEEKSRVAEGHESMGKNQGGAGLLEKYFTGPFGNNLLRTSKRRIALQDHRGYLKHKRRKSLNREGGSGHGCKSNEMLDSSD